MDPKVIVYAAYVFLASYCSGSILTLQLQHYAIYSKIGKESFQAYIQANNRAAVLPAILPSFILFVCTAVLIFYSPAFLSLPSVVVSILMNLVILVSTIIWQGRLHTALAQSGFDERNIRLLVSTNWIRTIAFFVQAGVAVSSIVAGVAK